MSASGFDVLAGDGDARRGRLRTPHGAVETPAFLPVGTRGTVKAMSPDELRAAGAEIVLANTYHLYLRPGHEVVRALGGLHRFMGWDGPILTDSGGFQAFSMAGLTRIDDDGVRFRSHVDGSSHELTPERSMEIQAALGSDVAMVLDECPELPAPRDRVEAAVARTSAWARRSRDAWTALDPSGVAFGIVQGGTWPELRERSARELMALDFPGYAIGGVSVGEAPEAIARIAGHTARLLPADRPRYLMGVGRPEDLLAAIAVGVDLFDCVMPTRNARNGTLFTRTGRINIKRREFAIDPRPVDESCRCEACRRFSRAYLRHLFLCGEILGARLNTLHNLTFYLELMRGAREAIAEGAYGGFAARVLEARAGEAPA